jgi:hypothetical protein
MGDAVRLVFPGQESQEPFMENPGQMRPGLPGWMAG